jgi:hypothetical protein
MSYKFLSVMEHLYFIHAWENDVKRRLKELKKVLKYKILSNPWNKIVFNDIISK